MIEVQEFITRRNKLYDKLKDNSVLILFAGASVKRSADETYPFTINKNFYYLTGIEQEGSILVVSKQDKAINESLFISEYDEVKEKWTGKRLRVDEAKKKSGINNIFYLNTFQSEINTIITRKKIGVERISTIYLDLEPQNMLDNFKTTKDYLEIFELNYPWVTVLNIYNEIIRLRMVKSSAEVEELKDAISKTNIGLKQILKNLEPGKYEYQLSSLFYYTIQDNDHSELSFPTICASGVNATCLHYPNASSKIADGDLVLFDLGSQNNYYCGDISRTYPANGKFSQRQKDIYNIVLATNKLVAESVRPGVTLKELNDIATKNLAEGLLKLGLIENESEVRKYYFHSIGHHLGLDTHDPSIREEPLVSGNVITDEPGLYIKELGIGIRIEDDILVTDDGSYVLSGKIIKEIDEIEKAMESI